MTNCTLITRKSKSWDLHLNWLRCIQGQFHIYWHKVPNNNSDYSTKYHPIIYHETSRSMGFAGCVFYPDIFIDCWNYRLNLKMFQQGCIDILI